MDRIDQPESFARSEAILQVKCFILIGRFGLKCSHMSTCPLAKHLLMRRLCIPIPWTQDIRLAISMSLSTAKGIKFL